METIIEDFPHHNAHYANDDVVAIWTIMGISSFVIALCMLTLFVL